MRLYSLQALRFWAALAVCVFHGSQVVVPALGRAIPAWLAATGNAGVDVFFVLSGYIIASTSGGLSPGQFAARRAQRILPLWWATALPLLAWALVMGLADWRSALATVALWPATDVLRPPASIGWTLSFEALFYAAATLVLWRRWTLWPLLATLAAALAVHRGAVLQFVGNPLVLEFLAGVLLTRAPRAPWPRMTIAAALVAMLLGAQHLPELPALALLRGDFGWSRLALLGLPAVLIVWSTLQLDVGKGLLSRLGDASYALYLLHPMLLVGGFTALAGLKGYVPPLLALAVVVAAIAFLSLRVHELFEKPVLLWLRGSKRLATAQA